MLLLMLLCSSVTTVAAPLTSPGDASERTRVGILLFEGVDVLDVTGPYEVFSLTRLQAGIQSRFSTDTAPFQVFTVAESLSPIKADGGLSINPDYSFANVPAMDLLIVPGGPGARRLVRLDHSPTLDWIRHQGAAETQLISVCTGALLLARTKQLSGKRATTHWGALELLASLDKTILVQQDLRYVDDGVITSAGVSSGIDMSLYIVEKLLGPVVARDTAKIMDYRYPRP